MFLAIILGESLNIFVFFLVKKMQNAISHFTPVVSQLLINFLHTWPLMKELQKHRDILVLSNTFKLK